MSVLGTSERPLRVAIVGSGPSGFYTADYLLKQSLNIKVDMFDKLPAPYGLVRYGVAPDHVKINQISTLSVTANGGDYNYTFEWTDSYGNIISNDPNLDYDDGTRTLTPYIPSITRTLVTPSSEISNYMVKVTDGNGKIATSTVQISRD